eukprot:4230983-Amphidinium_carterae.1
MMTKQNKKMNLATTPAMVRQQGRQKASRRDLSKDKEKLITHDHELLQLRNSAMRTSRTSTQQCLWTTQKVKTQELHHGYNATQLCPKAELLLVWQL